VDFFGIKSASDSSNSMFQAIKLGFTTPLCKDRPSPVGESGQDGETDGEVGGEGEVDGIGSSSLLLSFVVCYLLSETKYVSLFKKKGGVRERTRTIDIKKGCSPPCVFALLPFSFIHMHIKMKKITHF